MVGKRKVDQLRTNIAKMARAAKSGDKEEFQKASQNVPILLEKNKHPKPHREIGSQW